MNQNKIKNTRVGDDIHFYVNGVEDRGIVVKMNNEYVTVFKESTQNYDDIHINDTFFIKDILVNKEWDNMDDTDRYNALVDIHAPSPTYLMKTWDQLPKEIKVLLQKNNAVETSHKESDDMDVATRTFDGKTETTKGFGGTERNDETGNQGGRTGEKRHSGEKHTQHAGDKEQGDKYATQTLGQEGADKFGQGERPAAKEEEKGHTRASDKLSLLSQQVSEDPQIKEADRRVESSLGNRAEVQSARKLAETEAKKLKERKERKTQAEAGKDAPVPKKVTEGVSALKAWQQWLAQRQEQINKDAKDGKQGGKPKEPREIYDDTGKKIKEPDSTQQSRSGQELRGRIEDVGSASLPTEDVRHTELGVDRYHESVVGHNKEEYNQHEKDKKGNVRLGQRGQSDFSDTGSSSITSTDGQERDNKGKLTGKSIEEKLLELKSNVENSVHGNAARNPTSGVNTNTSFDAPEDYEGHSHSGKREGQFKYEDKKPSVGQKLSKVNIKIDGSETPTTLAQGTGEGGNKYDTAQQNNDKKGRADNQVEDSA
tara:strand:- start:897 stop:2519 length:1623 start_codon:yes stop_codon:yes gene_type:complete